MIRKFSFLILALFLATDGFSQTIKTGVVVIGNTAASAAAAIQSARSGANTLLITGSPALNPTIAREDFPYLDNVINHYKRKQQRKDSLITTLDTTAQASYYSQLVKSIADTVKNLQINTGATVSRAEKDGKGWELRLNNGRRIKADVILDATENASVSAALGIPALKTMWAGQPDPLASKLFRSTVTYGKIDRNGKQTFTPIPLGAFIPAGQENFVVIPKDNLTMPGMAAGQAAGTIAAYCAFFKTTTDKINVRIVQGELMAFDALLIPFADIPRKDPNAMAFQRMAVSGLLEPHIGTENTMAIRLDTAGTISSEELRAPMREFYSRSQIWFADNKKEIMTIGDVISLIQYVAARGDELPKEIENAWQKSFRLNGPFDLNRPINRKEFAVLADKYLQPFNVKVDFAGNLLS